MINLYILQFIKSERGEHYMTKKYKLHYHSNLNLDKETTIELKSVEDVGICPH